MDIQTIDPIHPSREAIQAAVNVLRAGGILIYPTDTTYGLGIDPTNQHAFERLHRLKGRDIAKGVSLILPDSTWVARVAMTDQRIERILEAYLPGPYSFLLVNRNFSYCPLSAVMIRIPNHPTTQSLADGFGFPYTSTSANFSGEPPAYSLAELEETLLNPERMVVPPDLIVDSGPLPQEPPSTIVDLTKWPPVILRQGTAKFDWQQFD